MPCWGAPRVTLPVSRTQQAVCNKAQLYKLQHSSGRTFQSRAQAVDWGGLNLLPGQAACGVILLAWSFSKRPVGWSVPEVEVRASPVSGKGVFARSRIEEGTAIGRFGGVLRTPDEMALKAQNAPNSKNYVFQTDNGDFWDPTDSQGNVSQWPGPNFPWPFPVDPAMAYVNEPPIGAGGTNVYCTNGASGSDELLYVATRTILPETEIFVDYGLKYDRSHYGGEGVSETDSGGYVEPKEKASVGTE